MIVWLASYPRSGNTFLRIVLDRVYGVRSSVVYDTDGIAERLGREFVGFAERADLDAARQDEALHFIKTHRQHDERVHEEDRAICLTRDGRDALVSYARMLSEEAPGTFEERLRGLIEQPDGRGTGRWGANVLSWLAPGLDRRAVIRFEDLVARPEAVVAEAMRMVAPQLSARGGAVPDFAELAEKDAGFFRKGVAGGWRSEMPPALHDLFWAQADNRAAMERLAIPSA
jgi:hypothetical protein